LGLRPPYVFPNEVIHIKRGATPTSGAKIQKVNLRVCGWVDNELYSTTATTQKDSQV
jgi:hypothetical protein